ncbi:MAG: hypothetical protein ACREA0_01620 [bacterium]
MINYTPQPWSIGYSAIDDSPQIDAPEGALGYTAPIAELWGTRANENARLIVAAPRMYRFLRAVARGGDTPFECDAQILLKEIEGG